MTSFAKPRDAIGGLSGEAAANLAAAAGDVTLALDGDGVVQDIAVQSETLAAELGKFERWIGKRWADLTTVESKPKIAALLRDAASQSGLRWRQVNHPVPPGPDIPIQYRTLQISSNRIVAIGRDLRSVSALQQRLMDAQQSMERDYSRLRNIETRYRLLFQMSAEPVLIVDAGTLKVIEANPVADRHFQAKAKRLVGRNFVDLFPAADAGTLENAIAGVRASGRSDQAVVADPGGGGRAAVDIAIFRQDSMSIFLVRLFPAGHDRAESPDGAQPGTLQKLIDRSPDGFLISDADGRVLAANAAFLEMAQLASLDQARSETIEKWLGRDDVDFNVLMANLRQRGSVRLFATSLRGEFSGRTDVEISANRVTVEGGTEYCFAIRKVGSRVAGDRPRTTELPKSVEQLTELVGRVPLKELVRETTDMIERLCIEAALELTQDNRASASEMLGLSRQSLYVKLRRYGLSDLSADGDAQD
jgi:transcriptional regulator PpsR